MVQTLAQSGPSIRLRMENWSERQNSVLPVAQVFSSQYMQIASLVVAVVTQKRLSEQSLVQHVGAVFPLIVHNHPDFVLLD